MNPQITEAMAAQAARYGVCEWSIGGRPCGRHFRRENPSQTVCGMHSLARRNQLQRERMARLRQERTQSEKFALS